MTSKDPIVCHPWLLAISPVLFLYARNMGELDFRDVVYSAAIALALAGLLLLVLRYPVKSRLRRGLMASCLIILVYAYTPLSSAIGSILPFLPADRWTPGYYAAWLAITAAALAGIARLDRSLANWTKILNVIAVCLAALNAVSILRAVPAYWSVWKSDLTIPDPWQSPVVADADAERPDIYILIFDQHVGQACLDRYGYDASEFFEALRSRGFYVGEHSSANYWKTPYSLTCLFNYTYLDFIKKQVPPDFKGLLPVYKLMRDNRAFRFLKEAGYTTMQCHTSFSFAYENIDVIDAQINPEPWYTSALSMEMFGNTPFCGIRKLFEPLPFRSSDIPANHLQLRRAILSAFEETQHMAHYDKPFILFTHFLSPHPPYLFDERGDLPGADSAFRDFPVQFCADRQKDELRLYLAQMTYLHQRIIETVDYLLAHSTTPPIIVLQADHGNRLQDIHGPIGSDGAIELYSILNAMYLPGVDTATLGDDISPVNTFRIIFDRYFGTDLGLLPNRSFRAGSSDYDFQDVTLPDAGDSDAD